MQMICAPLKVHFKGIVTDFIFTHSYNNNKKKVFYVQFFEVRWTLVSYNLGSYLLFGEKLNCFLKSLLIVLEIQVLTLWYLVKS